MNSSVTGIGSVDRSRTGFVVAVVGVLILIGGALSAFVMPVSQDEDRPPIIVSSGSVIINVARGSWVREAAGRYRQDVARGRDVRSFSATTGTGNAACTVSGDSIVVTYGGNAITFGRPGAPAAPGQSRASTVSLPANANVTERDARTLVVDTTDPLVRVSSGGNTCPIAGGRVEIRQVH